MCRFYKDSELQKKVLKAQVQIAQHVKLPIVIHARDAEHDIMEELEKVC